MGCFLRSSWPLRLGNSRGPGWAFPTASSRGSAGPSQGARPLLAPAVSPPSQAGLAPISLMPESQRQNVLQGPGSLAFVQKGPAALESTVEEGTQESQDGRPRVRTRHSLLGQSDPEGRAHRTSLSRAPQGSGAQHSSGQLMRPGWGGPTGLWEVGLSCRHQKATGLIVRPEELSHSHGEDSHEGHHHEDDTDCPDSIALCPPLGGQLSGDHAGQV